MRDAARSMRLGRRGFCPAVDHPDDRAKQFSRRRRRRGSGVVLTGVLFAVSIAELTWILVR